MADDTATPATGESTPDPDKLGDNGEKALRAERAARREAEQHLKALQDRLAGLEDKDKSESERLTAKLAAAEKERDDAKAATARLEVAIDKGLTKTQAKRLVGATVDELEADADDLLSSFKPAEEPEPNGKPPSKPSTDLRGGTDPTSDPPVDISKVIESIPRDL